MRNRRESFCIMAIVALSSLSAVPAVAQQVTDAAVSAALTKAAVLTKSFQVRVAGSHCTVVTYRNPKASERDVKIDAILTAKAVRDAFPSIEAVTVQFYEQSNLQRYRYIEVHRGDIVSFGGNSSTKEQLLSSLIVHESGPGMSKAGLAAAKVPLKGYHVLEGFNVAGRGRMYYDLVSIQDKGGDVSELWARFLSIEDQIKKGESDSTVNEYNALVPDVFQALQAANRQSARIAEDSRLRNNQLESQSAVGQILQRQHPGYAFVRRQRLAREIDRQAAMGIDVQYYQAVLWNQVEQLCLRRQEAEANNLMGELEKGLHLSPYTGPM